MLPARDEDAAGEIVGAHDRRGVAVHRRLPAGIERVAEDDQPGGVHAHVQLDLLGAIAARRTLPCIASGVPAGMSAAATATRAAGASARAQIVDGVGGLRDG